MKEFINELVNKYWNSIEQEILGCGFSLSNKNIIKKEIDSYIEENNLYDFNIDEFRNDSNEYIKYYAYRRIMQLFIEQLEQKYARHPETPKRFKQYYGPRD